MLKGIDSRINADLLYILGSMGHGDQVAIVDRNFPETSGAEGKELARYDGLNATQALEMVLSLFPLDTFVEAPVYTMQVVGKPDEILPFHKEGQEICDRIEGRKIKIQSLERFAFYKQVEQCFAIISTSEDRPYGNFILVKGVL